MYIYESLPNRDILSIRREKTKSGISLGFFDLGPYISVYIKNNFLKFCIHIYVIDE